jgi:hypothetical protein
LETKTAWPGSKQDKPAGWEDWSEKARAAFLEIWENADDKLRAGLIEDVEERKGNQKDMEDYFIFLNESKECLAQEEKEEFGLGGAGCSLVAAMILLIAALLIPLIAS